MRKILVIPDTHAPKHDDRAYSAMLDFARDWKPDGAIILGDFGDYESLIDAKKGPSDPRRITYEEETRGVCSLLDRTDRALGKQCKDKYYIEGNHELRQDSFVVAHPELAAKIDIKKDLGLAKRGWKWHPRGRRTLRIGKAQFHHGAYTNRHHAAEHATKMGGNIIYGHLHDMQSATVVHGMTPHAAWCLGCLCDLDQKYMEKTGRPHNWSHGFGVLYIRPGGDFNLYPVFVYNGKFIGPNGKLYSR